MKINAIIADDEPHLAEHLASMIQTVWPVIEITEIVHDGYAAVAAVERLRPDIAFLDIRLPGISGIEAGRRFSTDTHVVFVTAYDNYAVRAFELGAIDYLLKPLTEERLAQTINRIKPYFCFACPRQRYRGVDFPKLLHVMSSGGNEHFFIRPMDVLFFQSMGNYLLVEGRERRGMMRASLSEVRLHLDPCQFVQIHRGTLVNIDAVACVRRQGHGAVVTLCERNIELRVSRQFAHLMLSKSILGDAR